MGLRQRSGFDGMSSDVKREDLNLTQYEEKYILPTDGGALDRFGRTDRAAVPPAGVQSPVQTPAPDPTESGFVFGERSSAFGERRSDESRPASPYSAPTQTGERPMVFVLRDDKNMYVYEYSDRLEYYRRTDLGMVYCATKFRVKRV